MNTPTGTSPRKAALIGAAAGFTTGLAVAVVSLVLLAPLTQPAPDTTKTTTPKTTDTATLTATDTGVQIGSDDQAYTAINITIDNTTATDVYVNPDWVNVVTDTGTVLHGGWGPDVWLELDPVTLAPGQNTTGRIAVAGGVLVGTVEVGDIACVGGGIAATVE